MKKKQKQSNPGSKRRLKKLSPSTNPLQGTDVESLEHAFVNHLEFSLAKDEYSATKLDAYKSLALTVRDRLIERWIETQQTYYKKGAKRVYYLSMEFLVGRLLGNGASRTPLRMPTPTPPARRMRSSRSRPSPPRMTSDCAARRCASESSKAVSV